MCTLAKVCTNQKFSLTCVLEDFSLVSIKRHRVILSGCPPPFSLKIFEMIPLPAPSKKKVEEKN